MPPNEAEKFLDPKTQMFPTWEPFVAANLRDAQLCAVMIKIEDRPAEQIRALLASAMPDHALPTVSGNTNAPAMATALHAAAMIREDWQGG